MHFTSKERKKEILVELKSVIGAKHPGVFNCEKKSLLFVSFTEGSY